MIDFYDLEPTEPPPCGPPTAEPSRPLARLDEPSAAPAARVDRGLRRLAEGDLDGAGVDLVLGWGLFEP